LGSIDKEKALSLMKSVADGTEEARVNCKEENHELLNKENEYQDY
jgi:hypothetical protein